MGINATINWNRNKLDLFNFIIFFFSFDSFFYLVVKFKNVFNSQYLTAYKFYENYADIDTYSHDIEGIAPYQRWILKQIGKNIFYIINFGSFCFLDAYFDLSNPSFSMPICTKFTGSPSQKWLIDGEKKLILNHANYLSINYYGYFVSKDKTDPYQQWIIEEA